MDKSWIDIPRMSREYLNGIDKFLEFAYTGRLDGSFINCPCRKCENRYNYPRAAVKEHLYSIGFFKKYKNWTNHGEPYAAFHGDQDKNPRVGPVYYYGWLTDIVEIRYTNDTKYVMFKCDWIDNLHGKKEDAFKFTLVNFNHLLYREDQATNEPYILASQSEQVWYVPDPIEPDWQVAVKMSERGLYDMHSDDPQVEPYLS